MLGSVARCALCTGNEGRRRRPTKQRNMPVKNNQIVTIVLGAGAALLALSLIVRFVLLSQSGASGRWLFFGLPFRGLGLFVLLLRLGILNFGGPAVGTGPSRAQDI